MPPRRLNPRIPRDLETIALKCLEKNASRRYASAEILADDMRRWLDNRPILARPVSPVEHAARWCRRQPVIAALAATSFVTVIGGILGLSVLLRRSEANYQMASQSLDELLSIFNNDEMIYYRNHGNQRLEAVETARRQAIELSERHPLYMRGLRRLAVIDQCLASFRERAGKRDEARSLTEESINYWEACLALAPDDLDIHRRLLKQTGGMLASLTNSSSDHLYKQWNARAVTTL